MELKRLSYFVRVADDGSLTKASGVLRVAQPALSRQIRLLEEELSVTLFQRSAHGMRLTREGEYLRAAVAGPLRTIGLALQNVRSLSSPIQGDFAIGMPPGLADLLAQALAACVRAKSPAIQLRIVEGPTGSLIDWLNRGMVDCALLEEAPKDDRLSHQELFSERLVLVGGRQSERAPEASPSFREAAALPLIVPSHHLGIRAILNDAAAKARAKLNICMEADAPRLIVQLIAAGHGASVLPPSYVQAALRAGEVATHTIEEAELRFTPVIASRKNSPAERGAIEHAITEYIYAVLGEVLPGSSSGPIPSRPQPDLAGAPSSLERPDSAFD